MLLATIGMHEVKVNPIYVCMFVPSIIITLFRVENFAYLTRFWRIIYSRVGDFNVLTVSTVSV